MASAPRGFLYYKQRIHDIKKEKKEKKKKRKKEKKKKRKKKSPQVVVGSSFIHEKCWTTELDIVL